MISAECNGGNQSNAFKDSKGNFWFSTIKGAVCIDTNNIKTNKVIPPVHIEEVLIDDISLDFSLPLKFEYNTENYEIKYTACSFINPKKVFFKYKLIGYDEDWISAGTERETKYMNLPAGEYTFKVIACNNDGLWNEEGASFSFEVLPPFWQTWWFYFICIISGIILIVLIVWLFTYRLRKRKEQLEELVRRRTKELQERHEVIHDNLLYAQKIQQAILPMKDEIMKSADEYFLIWQEKDIVGGIFIGFIGYQTQINSSFR